MRRFKFIGMLVAAAFVAALLTTSALAHNNPNVTSSISPADGSTITTTSIALTATFGGGGNGTGCGLTTTITPTVSSGQISNVSTSCVDSLWTWTATWSGYASGQQTVTVSFLQVHGLDFTHTGSVSATYNVILPTDCPAAPAVAAHLLQAAGMNLNDADVKNYVAQVADQMGPQTYFDGVDACDLTDYEATVDAFLQSIGAFN